MSDDPALRFDGLTQWLGEDPDDAPPPTGGANAPDREPGGDRRRRSSPRRIARAGALVAPWLVALAVLVSSTGTTDPAADATPPVAPQPPPTPEGTATSPVPAGAAATAVRLVRDALTRQHAGASAAVDVAVAESPQPLGADQWAVRVQAVVLRGDARRWRSATHETWVVPVGLHAGRPVGLDHPWRVATEDPAVTPVRWSAAAVDERAVRSALRTIGVRAARDLHAQQHPALAHIVRVRVADGYQIRHLWLTTRPTVHVVGAPAGTAAPSEQASP